jgi:hypothetical protein
MFQRGPGLPDGLFSNKNPRLGKFWRVLEWKMLVFYDYLEYFTSIWYYLWPFGMIFGHLVLFSQIGMFGPRKIWQPWRGLHIIHYICHRKFCQIWR